MARQWVTFSSLTATIYDYVDAVAVPLLNLLPVQLVSFPACVGAIVRVLFREKALT